MIPKFHQVGIVKFLAKVNSKFYLKEKIDIFQSPI